MHTEVSKLYATHDHVRTSAFTLSVATALCGERTFHLRSIDAFWFLGPNLQALLHQLLNSLLLSCFVGV